MAPATASNEPIRVLITGAAGQIAYSLIPLIAKGEVFGQKQEIILHLLDIQPMLGVLNGVAMEISDCAFPLLRDVVATADVAAAFKGISYAFLVGAMPRREGMERKDLLKANVRIFKDQGGALDQFAKKDVKVLVVGNPANTNALICSKYAPSIPKENITAMTRLDQNRATAQVAQHVQARIQDVRKVIIWGNHSNTQFPDARFVEVQKDGSWTSISKVQHDEKWLKESLIPLVQKRGAEVIAARKLSSAMSAAQAAADHMRNWFNGTEKDQWVNMAVVSKGEYGIPEGLVFSFPVTVENGQWKIVPNLAIDDFSKEKLKITTTELEEERTEAHAACE
ncbi:malate dehydrogenase, cytoplasmic-like [Paramacrobiotus metropolitanus]|uniref:malate dehydrogenase, cytoplasmic-like n=1 Tax=Paramacrobiotus metropolitanus TaxID=2943436 RepID=UPI002445AC06|nr:malate dehydrogenase, cytoplasmic-like [Paramacrobiotus metropolitanus]